MASESVPRGNRDDLPQESEESRIVDGSSGVAPEDEEGVAARFTKSELGKQVSAFIGHLEELRNRLIRAILGVVAGLVICLFFSERLVGFIIRTAGDPEKVKFSLLKPTEGILVYMKVGLVAGIFLSSPIWFGQLWGFISPGLYRREKRVVIPVIAASVGAFLIGAAFGYMILPYTSEYFLSFTTPQVQSIWSLSSYVDMALQFMLAFGVVFELPLILYAAALLGLVTPKQLRYYRRHAIVGIVFVAGVITPGPDVFSQVVVAIPLIILYEVGIILTAMAVKPRPVEPGEE